LSADYSRHQSAVSLRLERAPRGSDSIVTSGTRSPTLGKAIALGYVSAAAAALGTEVRVEIRGRRVLARIVRIPFVR